VTSALVELKTMNARRIAFGADAIPTYLSIFSPAAYLSSEFGTMTR